MNENLQNEYDIAVVGGGIGGIYAAWRLMKEDAAGSPALNTWKGNGKLRIAVFESSGRIGGRLLSAMPPGMNAMTCELGGMRYVSSQKIVSALIEQELKLPRHEQDVTEPINIVYLRGRRLRSYQMCDPELLPYGLDQKEKAWLSQGNMASDLIGWAVEQLLPEVKNMNGDTLEKYLQNAKVEGVPLYQQGFWNLISRAMTNEAYELAIKTVGYDSLGMNANSVNSICEYFNFAPGVKYYLLDNGYDSVPWTLQNQFTEAGGEVHLNSRLESVDETVLENGAKGVSLQFAGSKHIKAKAVILAMPPRSIELLQQKGPVLDPARAPNVRFMLNAVTPVGLYKMFLVYQTPWWEKTYVTKGRSLTDMPLRQCYYWGVENRLPGGNPDSTNAVLMAYNDMQSSGFWGGLRTTPLGPDNINDENKQQHKPRSLHPPAKLFENSNLTAADSVQDDPVKQQLLDNWNQHPAPEKMVAEMHRQLVELHGAGSAPEPIGAAFKDWSDDPYGGAVHFWNSGYKTWEVMDEMTHPVKDFPCYICGEAFSTNQTWVEGALQTAEIVLQSHFGLGSPQWMKND